VVLLLEAALVDAVPLVSRLKNIAVDGMHETKIATANLVNLCSVNTGRFCELDM
jgi:hypothetical protein